MNDREMVQTLVERFAQRARATFGKDLVSIVLYGSVARGDFKSTSDIDLLVVFETLPPRRGERYVLTRALEEEVAESVPGNFGDAHWHGFSLIRKTRAEAQRTSLYYLDLTTDAVLLYDRDQFFQNVPIVYARVCANLARKKCISTMDIGFGCSSPMPPWVKRSKYEPAESCLSSVTGCQTAPGRCRTPLGAPPLSLECKIVGQFSKIAKQNPRLAKVLTK
ncbi:MAG: nucleotidyltransferase domain-containing protein [Chloroflexi bacterium]|nr:nucleotidyltransferase domain-containing protein [Chloroflexota bacterium]